MAFKSYRLGDSYFIGQNMGEEEYNSMIKYHPNTIASDFLLEKKKWLKPSYRKIDVMFPIVQKYLKKYENLMPSDIKEATVIHLRLGDALCGTTWHELAKRPICAANIRNKVLSRYSDFKFDNVYVIGKAHFQEGCSTGNWDEGRQLSDSYMKDVLDEFKATHFNGGSADIDFCCGVMAKNFVRGRGHFSTLITVIRDKMGKKSVSPY